MRGEWKDSSGEGLVCTAYARVLCRGPNSVEGPMHLFSVIAIILTPSTLNSSCHGGGTFISSGKASDPFPRLGAKTSQHTSLDSTDLHRAQTLLKALYGLYLSKMELENNTKLPEPKSAPVTHLLVRLRMPVLGEELTEGISRRTLQAKSACNRVLKASMPQLSLEMRSQGDELLKISSSTSRFFGESWRSFWPSFRTTTQPNSGDSCVPSASSMIL